MQEQWSTQSGCSWSMLMELSNTTATGTTYSRGLSFSQKVYSECLQSGHGASDCNRPEALARKLQIRSRPNSGAAPDRVRSGGSQICGEKSTLGFARL